MDKRFQLLLTSLSSAAVGGLIVYFTYRRSKAAPAAAAAPDVGAASTTSSAQGVGVYETQKAVAEYLMFHFGAPADILPYPPSIAPHGALDFAARTGRMCARAAAAAGLPLDAALDVGCAVGGTSFELSRDFSRVMGVDFSHAFVEAANALKASGAARYACSVEGELCAERNARVPAGVRAERVAFRQGDACALATAAELGGRFTVVHGANLLCRLPDPMLFLRRLPELLVPRGLVVLVSPFSWLPQYTPREKWLGGRASDSVASLEGLRRAMEGLNFDLVSTEDTPFLIREHARKYQLGFSCVTVWQLRA